MKRYLTFIGPIYYPFGGMEDFTGDFDNLEEAKIFVEEKVKEDNDYETLEEKWDYYWAHIWDTETRSEVWSK